MRGPFPRPVGMRRVVVVVPSLFTLFNLFFGIWSMALASRGEFYRASWYIVFAGVLDTLDGRVARLSNTGSRFGAELDSLVDVVSFGVAPAFLIYMLVFSNAGQAEWIFCFFYVMAAAIRLALRVEQRRPRHHAHFHAVRGHAGPPGEGEMRRSSPSNGSGSGGPSVITIGPAISASSSSSGSLIKPRRAARSTP